MRELDKLNGINNFLLKKRIAFDLNLMFKEKMAITYRVRYFWGRVPNYNQSVAIRKQGFLGFSLLIG